MFGQRKPLPVGSQATVFLDKILFCHTKIRRYVFHLLFTQTHVSSPTATRTAPLAGMNDLRHGVYGITPKPRLQALSRTPKRLAPQKICVPMKKSAFTA